MKPATLAAILLVAFAASVATADRGSIPYRPGVKIFEPTQRAMICWNGEEEILVLSTDLKASAPTKVLEVMPFPNEPTVTKGDVEVFRKATALINRKLPRPSKQGAGRGAKSEPAGEVTFHEKIGAHDISVVRVKDGAGFVDWVEKYLKAAGVDAPSIPDAIKKSVEEYLRDGFAWFVFDVIELDDKPKTNDAIQYRFRTDHFYYPMRISRVEEGETSVELLVLTPRLLTNFKGIPASKIELLHEPVSLTSKELRELNKEMDDLLGQREDMKLRVWRVRGRLSSFDKDIWAN